MACGAAQAPSDAAPDVVSLPMMLSERLLADVVSAVEVLKHYIYQHFYTVHVPTSRCIEFQQIYRMNPTSTCILPSFKCSTRRCAFPQAVYLLCPKQQDWSSLLKCCVELVGERISQRCVASLAIKTASK